MAYLKQISLALGLAAVGVATPALAHNHTGELEATAEASVVADIAETNLTLEAIEGPFAAEASLLAMPETNVTLGSDVASANFDQYGIDTALLAATVETAPITGNGIDLAQVSPAGVGMPPAYIGVGGNIGIGNRGQSALSSFGFNIISKISLSNRFAVRAGATATNDRWSFTIPMTYNFNTTNFLGFTTQPYVGAGIEIPTSGDIGLLVNAGADIPISESFTLNAAGNFRLTSGFALGVSLGVGYNFPFFFD
jgi:hypothetical protein